MTLSSFLMLLLIYAVSIENNLSARGTSSAPKEDYSKTSSLSKTPTLEIDASSNVEWTIPSTLGINMEEFKEHYNAHARDSGYPQLQIGEFIIELGEEQDGVSYRINPMLELLTSVNKADGSIRDATLIYQRDDTVDSMIEFFLSIAYIVRAFDPGLEEPGEILRNFGLTDSSSGKALLENTHTIINDTIYAMGPQLPDGFYFTMLNKNDSDLVDMPVEETASYVEKEQEGESDAYELIQPDEMDREETTFDEVIEDNRNYRMYVNGEPVADFPKKQYAEEYADLQVLLDYEVRDETEKWQADVGLEIPEHWVNVNGENRASFYTVDNAIAHAKRFERAEVWVPNTIIWSNIPVSMYQEDTFIGRYESEAEAIEDAAELEKAKLVDEGTGKVIWDNYPRECRTCDSSIKDQY